jgi:hypothetical protein
MTTILTIIGFILLVALIVFLLSASGWTLMFIAIILYAIWEGLCWIVTKIFQVLWFFLRVPFWILMGVGKLLSNIFWGIWGFFCGFCEILSDWLTGANKGTLIAGTMMGLIIIACLLKMAL